jgi:hypothetical protein
LRIVQLLGGALVLAAIVTNVMLERQRPARAPLVALD